MKSFALNRVEVIKILRLLNKKIFSVLITILMIISALFSNIEVDAANAKPSRIINLVYDDSGSMIEDGSNYLDRWCQAKYALEVFAAMLEENDTMNVYAMSDFSYSNIDYSKIQPHITLLGSSATEDNAAAIHTMLTYASSTPFQTVEKAYSDLVQSSADEKWLVVLTDGVFTKDFKSGMNISQVNDFFNKKNDDISLMYLAIGNNAMNISGNDSKNIYAFSAANSIDILSKLTEMSNRIFERNRLQVDPANGNFSFDISMGELIVFAQGKNVDIKGINKIDGSVIAAASDPVEVKYSEVAALNYNDDKNVVVNDNLVGKIAYFNGEFDAGDYMVDAPGASTVEVYYRPNVDIAVHLVNSEGTRLSTLDPIPQDTYTLEYGFVKPGTDEMLPASKLLGDIDFSATVSFNGKSDGKKYFNGDSITVPEGSMDIDATAEYLDYNTVSTSLHYNVFQDRPLNFKIDDSNVYKINTNGFENPNAPMTLTVSLNDRKITQEEWNDLYIPKIEFISKENLGDLTIKKTDQIGVFEIYPSIYNDSPFDNALGDFTFHVSLQQKIGMNVWSGQTDGVLHIADGISPFERYPWLIPVSISLVSLILLFIWWITRKVLPKKIKILPGSTQFYVSPNPFPQEGMEAECAYKRKSKRIEINSPPCEQNYEAQCSVTLMLKAVDRRYVKSKNRRVCVAEIRTSGVVYNVTINGVMYAKNAHGKWIEEAYLDTDSKRKLEQIIKNANIEMKTGSPIDVISRCECQLKHI